MDKVYVLSETKELADRFIRDVKREILASDLTYSTNLEYFSTLKHDTVSVLRDNHVVLLKGWYKNLPEFDDEILYRMVEIGEVTDVTDVYRTILRDEDEKTD